MHKKIAIGAFLLLAITGCSPIDSTAKPSTNCINLVIDYASLNADGNRTECIDSTTTANTDVIAYNFLRDAGVSIDGTNKYGLNVVCRVNGFPSATNPIKISDHENYIEPCKNMPPEFAYWALLVKDPGGKWKWAESGISKLKLKSGSSIALVFSENGNTRFPNE